MHSNNQAPLITRDEEGLLSVSVGSAVSAVIILVISAIKTMTMMPLNLCCCLAALVLLLSSCNGFATKAGRPQQLRSLQEITAEIISTADCNNVRVATYNARLDLYFFYLLEYEERMEADLDLLSINRAIATEITKILNECDDWGRPKYALSLNPSAHMPSKGGKFALVGVSWQTEWRQQP